MTRWLCLDSRMPAQGGADCARKSRTHGIKNEHNTKRHMHEISKREHPVLDRIAEPPMFGHSSVFLMRIKADLRFKYRASNIL